MKAVTIEEIKPGKDYVIIREGEHYNECLVLDVDFQRGCVNLSYPFKEHFPNEDGHFFILKE
jgi:hypothetical protein